MHKTIHLAASVGLNNTVNLLWDDYEGISYSTFYIYRYTVASGWDSLDAVPSNLHSYTDLNPPSPLVNVFYYVAVKNASGCLVSGKNPTPMAANLNFSKSNVNRLNALGVTPLADLASSIQVYPNPTTGKFKIQSAILKTGNAEVLDIHGRKVFSKNLERGTLNLDLSELNGIYFLRIVCENGTVTKKIVVQK
jgi:hypothetical protein